MLFAGFETAMPIVGLTVGRSLGSVFDAASDYVAIALLVAIGLYMLLSGEDDDTGLFESAPGSVPAPLRWASASAWTSSPSASRKVQEQAERIAGLALLALAARSCSRSSQSHSATPRRQGGHAIDCRQPMYPVCEVRTMLAQGLVRRQKAPGPSALNAEKTAASAEATRASVKKTAFLTAATLVSVNMWTGAPVLALWAGSRVVASPGLTMGAFWVVLVVLAVVESLLAVLLTWLNATYDRLTDRPVEHRRTSPWLRSMRGEREDIRRARTPSSPIEKAAMTSVVVAVLSLEVWFFFFAHTVLPHTSAGGL
jgi:hypothetical protein